MKPADGLALRTLVVLAGVVLCTTASAAPLLQPLPGDPAPELVLPDASDEVHSLNGYRGRVVLVNFWATWCIPCRQEMPSLGRLRERLAGEGLEVLAVNVDESVDTVRAFSRESGTRLTLLLDRGKRATRRWSVRVMPTTIIVDRQGRARYRVLGDIDWNSDAVVGTLNQLLQAR